MSAKLRKKPKRSLNPLKIVLIGGASLLVILVVGLLIAKSMLTGHVAGLSLKQWDAKQNDFQLIKKWI